MQAKKKTARKNAGQKGLISKGNTKQKAAQKRVTKKSSPAKKKRRLIFSTLKATRRTIARLARDYYENRLSENKLKNITYSARAIMAGFKLESEIDFEAQVREIREMIKTIKEPRIEKTRT